MLRSFLEKAKALLNKKRSIGLLVLVIFLCLVATKLVVFAATKILSFMLPVVGYMALALLVFEVCRRVKARVDTFKATKDKSAAVDENDG